MTTLCGLKAGKGVGVLELVDAALENPGGIHAICDQPRKVSHEVPRLDHPRAAARYLSPLRYPGAKAGLYGVLRVLFRRATSKSGIHVDLLIEPFAGGASTSLHLLAEGLVERALLADADPMVAAFWQVAAAQTPQLIARMREEHSEFVAAGGATALARWDYWKHWNAPAGSCESTRRFENAVKCLFLNRTTFSGILHGTAGPIGGRQGTSRYNIGCRFNPDELAERLAFVGYLYETNRIVDVWRSDWRETMDGAASRYKTLVPNNVIAYLDPPYIDKSDRLYPTSFARAFSHVEMSQYLREEARYRWVLSYDNHPKLLEHPYYNSGRMRSNPVAGIRAWPITKRVVRLNYTASANRGRGPKDELLITTLPPSTVPSDPPFCVADNGAPHR